MQRAAALDVGLDVEDQLLHRRLLVADAHDLEGLHQRDAGREHGRELAAEDRDVPGRDLAARAEEPCLLADPGGDDRLAAQFRAHLVLADRERAATDLVAFLVLALPVELRVFGGDGGRWHGFGRPLP